MAIAGKNYTDEVIRLADLFTTEDMLQGYRFTNCLLVGPSVVLSTGNTTFSNCRFGGKARDIYWTINVDEREGVIGALVFVDAFFERCTFENVGLAGFKSERDQFVQAMGEQP